MILTQTLSLALSGTVGTSLCERYRIAAWGDSLTQGIPGEREPWQDFLTVIGAQV